MALAFFGLSIYSGHQDFHKKFWTKKLPNLANGRTLWTNTMAQLMILHLTSSVMCLQVTSLGPSRLTASHYRAIHTWTESSIYDKLSLLTFRKSSCTPTTSAGTTLNSSINSVVLWNRRIINHRRSRDLRTLLLLDKIHLSPGRLTLGSNVFVTHFVILYLQRYFNWNNLCRNTLRFFKHQTLAPSIRRLTNYCQ